MRKVVIFLLGFFLGVFLVMAFVWWIVGAVVHADAPGVMEMLAFQRVTSSNKIPTHVQLIERWHDKESSVEFICVDSSWDGDPSCFPTRRNWK